MSMINFTILGMKLRSDTDFSRSYVPMAKLDFLIEPLGIKIRGATLASRHGRYIVQPPRASYSGGVFFDWEGEIAAKTAEKALAKYQELGGTLPREFIPVHKLDFTGIPEKLPERERVQLALERESDRRDGADLITQIYERIEPVDEPDDHVTPEVWEKCQNAA